MLFDVVSSIVRYARNLKTTFHYHKLRTYTSDIPLQKRFNIISSRYIYHIFSSYFTLFPLRPVFERYNHCRFNRFAERTTYAH